MRHLFIGAALLAFNGYEEDYETGELVTWPYAVGALAVSLGCFVGGYRLLQRPPR